mgnify:CR=1 FL=1
MIYAILIAIASLIALYLMIDLHRRRSKKEEIAKADWQDIWHDRLKRGK